MSFHTRVFRIAKKDARFQKALNLTKQKQPNGLLSSELEKGIWAAGYAGWVMGRYGEAEYLKQHDLWRKA